jgi:hypothetical protein
MMQLSPGSFDQFVCADSRADDDEMRMPPAHASWLRFCPECGGRLYTHFYAADDAPVMVEVLKCLCGYEHRTGSAVQVH